MSFALPPAGSSPRPPWAVAAPACARGSEGGALGSRDGVWTFASQAAPAPPASAHEKLEFETWRADMARGLSEWANGQMAAALAERLAVHILIDPELHRPLTARPPPSTPDVSIGGAAGRPLSWRLRAACGCSGPVDVAGSGLDPLGARLRAMASTLTSAERHGLTPLTLIGGPAGDPDAAKAAWTAQIHFAWADETHAIGARFAAAGSIEQGCKEALARAALACAGCTGVDPGQPWLSLLTTLAATDSPDPMGAPDSGAPMFFLTYLGCEGGPAAIRAALLDSPAPIRHGLRGGRAAS